MTFPEKLITVSTAKNNNCFLCQRDMFFLTVTLRMTQAQCPLTLHPLTVFCILWSTVVAMHAVHIHEWKEDGKLLSLQAENDKNIPG